MIRRNMDIVAVVVLAASALLWSTARKIELYDVFSHRAVVFQHQAFGPNIRVITLLPILGLAQD